MGVQEITNIRKYINEVLEETEELWENRSFETPSQDMARIIGKLRASLQIVDVNLEDLNQNLQD